MRKVIIINPHSPREAKEIFEGVLLRREDFVSEGGVFVPRQPVEYRTPEGKLVAMYIPDVFDEAEQEERHEVWRHLKGNLGNRPEVFGKGARQQKLTVSGELTARVGVPNEVLKEFGGNSETYGPFRGKNVDGKPNCYLTRATTMRPHLFLRAHRIAIRVSDLYHYFLPGEHALQMEYVNTVLPEWKLPGTAYTSLYGISRPTAVHIDEFDIPTATGALTTSGDFVGNEFCLPEFKLAFDVQPSDLLFVDVHHWHGNLPRISGERVAQVYFVRKGMHECGEANDAVSISAADIAAAEESLADLESEV